MVVFSCLILYSKFAKNRLSAGFCPDPLGELIQHSPRLSSWIMGEGRGKKRCKGRRGEKEANEGEGRRRKRNEERGRKGYFPNENHGYSPG